MKISLNHLFYSLTTLVLVTGCVPRIPPPQFAEQNKTAVHRTMWEDTSTVERNYSLKPEPYSLDSKQKDPELLGPQSTLKKSMAGNEMAEDSPTVQRPESSQPQFVSNADETENEASDRPTKPAMTRSRCIELIGQADYDKYTRQFGSEQAALRKCIILERVQRN